MSKENMNKEQLQSSQQGTGSAENTGRNRNEQQQPNTKLSSQERQDIGNQLGNDNNRVADLDDLGMLSGRDDAAGGSGDRMENESTGKETER